MSVNRKYARLFWLKTWSSRVVMFGTVCVTLLTALKFEFTSGLSAVWGSRSKLPNLGEGTGEEAFAVSADVGNRREKGVSTADFAGVRPTKRARARV